MIAKSLISILLLLTLTQASSNVNDQTQCDKFIQKFIDDLQNLQLSSIPTIIYSGITTNNPGEYKQCLDSNYSYFLIYFNNQTQPFKTYTGACVPQICSASDLEKALAFLDVTVYDYPRQKSADGLSITGLVFIALWAAGLTVWSCIVSMKQDAAKQLTKKDQVQRTSINAQSVQPLIQQVDQVVPDFKLFVFYQGYKQLFKAPNKISIFSPIIFFAVFSYLVSIQFSYRLSIAENQVTTAQNLLNSFWGLLACNVEIALHTIMFILGLRLAYGAYKINSFKQILRFYFDNILKKWLLLILMTFLIYSFVTMFTGEPLNKVWTLNNGQDCPANMWQIWFLFRFMVTDCKACLPWMSIISSQIFFIIIAAPLLLIFKTSKKIGYGLFTLLILLSMFVSQAILDGKDVIFEPSKLMNGQRQFVLGYQTNTFVRMGAFFFGLLFGLFMIEGLQKSQSSNSIESKAAKSIRRNNNIQIALQVVGLGLMIAMYIQIIAYLSLDAQNKQPHAYLITVPFFFIVGLAIFMLPSFWQGQSIVTRFTNTVLGWKKWVHLDNISMTYFMIGPMVIAYSNYNNQSNIYYDFTTVATYAIGDLVVGYILTLIIASAFEQQLNSLSSWLQFKVYGNQNKYSVLVIEQQAKQ